MLTKRHRNKYPYPNDMFDTVWISDINYELCIAHFLLNTSLSAITQFN